MWDMFPLNELQKAMEKDSDINSHPISFSVTKPSDIRRIFDPISYSKGASIIRMMSSFLGRDAFKAGVSQYLKTFSHSNADQNDLWEIMTEVGHTFKTLPDELDLKRVMDSWTLQAGYPVITVKRNDTDLVISQHRYMLPHKNENNNQKWYIPITLATKQDRLGQEQPQYWMTNKMDEMEISDAVNTTDWVYLNINRTGYYRVNYDYDSWKRLIRNFTEIPSVIKAQLIDDAFQLARAEYIDYDIPLTFLIVLAPHTKEIPAWAAAEKVLQYLTDMVIREPAYESYRGVMRTVLKGPFESVGFDEMNNEEHQKSMHRARILKLACEFGIDRCTNRAQILYRDWMRNAAENK
jgi:aminopeptidase N